MGKIEYQVGQRLWFVPPDKRSYPHFVTVLKIGRKWVELSSKMRVEKDSIQVNDPSKSGYGYLGTLYSTKEEYDQKVALEESWQKLGQRFEWRNKMPGHMTLEKVKQIEDILDDIHSSSSTYNL